MKKMFPDLEQEIIIDNFYRVDLFIPSENFVIEVNGQYHFNGIGQTLKKFITREKIIKKLGYKYVDVKSTIILKKQLLQNEL